MKNTDQTTLFGKYEIISILGTGQFSTVYLSKHKFLESYRAIKRIPKQNSHTDSLLKEATLLKSFEHPGIPIIYDIEEDESYFYLIEEYIEGETLEEFLLQQSHISQYTFMDLSLQLCNIFAYLHTRTPSPILYLDLKPEHIIVCGMKLKLIDFNVATSLANLGNICNLFGNEDFSAPELFSGSLPNLSSDIYSIGKIMQYLSSYLDLSLSPKFQQIIKKAAHADPARRFETVDELASAINQQKKLLIQPHLRKKIAILGSHSGCGATHIAISLVSALNYMGYSAIYLARNSHSGLQQIQNHMSFFKESNGMFRYRFFKGYPFYGPGISLPIPDADVIILDYGDDFSAENIDADEILLICSNAIWHLQDAFDKSDSLISFKDSLKIICNFGQKRSMTILSDYFSHPVFQYAFDVDPFSVSTSKIRFTKKLFEIKRRKILFFHLKKRVTKRN